MSVKLMAQVWELELPHAQMLVALALADHGNDDGTSIYPSLARVGWKCGYSERQIRRTVRELQSTGVLVKVADQRGTRPVEYRIDISAGTAKPPFGADKLSGGQDDRPDNDDCPGGHSRPARADTAMSAEPSLEPPFESEVFGDEASPHPPDSQRKIAGEPIAEVGAKPRLDVQAQIRDVFEDWRIKLGKSSKVTLTDQRARAIGGRLKRDGFTVDQLKQANTAAAQAVAEDDVFDYPEWATEVYRIFIDAEHVSAFIEYGETGDFYTLSEMLLAEEPKTASGAPLDDPGPNPF